ncbi:formimidoylglutamase [candidate division KSB1 bacterium]|nr:formimidoylglutamase [candidate division KSB1 bacterium]
MKNNEQNTGTHWRHHIRHINLDSAELEPGKGRAALLSFACDEGVIRNNGRPGAKAGPEEIRNALFKLAWHQRNDILDTGDVTCENGDLESAQKNFSAKISRLLNAGYFPIGIGGGHEIAFAHYLGIRDIFKGARLGIINFDAHFDMRIPVNGQSNSGTSFYQIAQHCKQHDLQFNYECIGIQKFANMVQLFETAQNLNAHWIYAQDITLTNIEPLQKKLDHFLDRVDHVYVSFCLDVFNVASAPGVSAINPLGPFPETIMALCKHIFMSQKVISMDIAELNPIYDVDFRTAKLAAGIIFSACEWLGI